MKLEAVNVQNFRSIQNITLEDCGGFNVIVGKNNAGKSNILLTLNAFFKSLKDGEPIILAPIVGSVLDHYKNQTSTPIQITVLFQLSLTERDSLIQDIVAESPQVKNSVGGIDPELRLVVTLEILTEPERFAYVKQILLQSPVTVNLSGDNQGVSHTVIEISSLAAKELVNKVKKSQDLKEKTEILRDLVSERLRRIDEDDWRRFKDNPMALIERIMLSSRKRSILRLPGNLASQLETLIYTADSKNDFLESASSLADSIEKEANNLLLEPTQHRINSFSGEESYIPKYAKNLIERIGKLKVLYLTERRDPIGKNEASQLLDLKVTRGGPEKLRAIQDTVSALLGVDIDAFRSEKSGYREEPEAELDVDQFIVQVNGAGIREALRLILDYELNNPDILLVEEPEIHLHPALETSIMRYLKAVGKDCQIFITTHSTNFLDTAEMRNVYLASREDSTTIQLINVEEAEQSIPRELGIRLSSLFMFDRLIFVEGPTDEDVIREWASILNKNLAQANIGFVSMGGVRNFAHFATEATINFLCKRQVELFFVLDHDERDEAEIDYLTRELGDKANLIVLEKRELENYLIVPRAIASFVELKHQLAGSKQSINLSISDIETAIEECAEKLKSVALERRIARITCAPIYPNRAAVLDSKEEISLANRLKIEYEKQKQKIDELEKTIDEIVDKQTTIFENKWISGKLKLVPGDMLLDCLCQSFGTRFNKEKDSSRLASLMNELEIDDEIKSMLENFLNAASA